MGVRCGSIHYLVAVIKRERVSHLFTNSHNPMGTSVRFFDVLRKLSLNNGKEANKEKRERGRKRKRGR